MEKLIKEGASLEAQLANPEIYGGPTAKLMELQVRHADVKATLTEMEETWLDLNERLETTQ